jgi:site-specific DNA recombinase
VLLSFAQFEREVIGERVRDKIAASKAKGIWVGGSVPLGYKSVNKKLVVVPEEAETIRLIFRRYLELGSVRDLAEDLDRKGTRKRKLNSGQNRGSVRFGVGYLATLLRNRFYVGEITHHGQVHPGEQQPILDRELFNTVQDKLAAGANARQLKLRASPSILAGRIFDEQGNRMTPVHTNKQGARYRYYVSHTALQDSDSNKSKARITAADLETAVLATLRKHLTAHRQELSAVTDRELIMTHVERVIVKSQQVEIRVGDGNLLSIQRSSSKSGAAQGVVHAPETRAPMSAQNRDLLLTAIAKARRWIDEIVEGGATSFADIAKREGKVERHIRLLALLALLLRRPASSHRRSVIFYRSNRSRRIDTWNTSAQTRHRLPSICGTEPVRRRWHDPVPQNGPCCASPSDA